MKMLLPVLALLVAACAAEPEPKEVEAVRDFVVANELEEVDEARMFGQMRTTYLNDYFVLLPSRRGDYLVEFGRRCRALRRQEFTPEMVDVRHDPDKLRARFDTLRGCRIAHIYSISSDQRKEIENLGDAPGDEIYLPDQDDTE